MSPSKPLPITRSSPIDRRQLSRARRLRREPTAAEEAAWAILRGRKILGLKFRRQQVIAGFVVDLYCAELHLVVELDGEVHEGAEGKEHDAVRSERLARRGIRVLRVQNEEVSEEFLRALLARCREV